MKIILDTNILRRDIILASSHFQILIDYSKRTYSEIVVPKIVWEELSSLYFHEISALTAGANKEIGELNRFLLDDKPEHLAIDIPERVSVLMNNVKNRLSVFHLKIPKYRDENLGEVVRRCTQKIKPCSSKGIEFRDTLLWLTIVDFIEHYDNVVFISNNIRDFGNQDGLDLHPDLKKELTAKNKSLRFYPTINHFIQDIAAPISFITEEWLLLHLDWEKIDSLLNERLGHTIHFSWYQHYFYTSVSDKHDPMGCESETIKPDRAIADLYVGDKDADGAFNVYFNLTGTMLIHFILEDEKRVSARASFQTSYDVRVKDIAIIESRNKLYQEESGFILEHYLDPQY